MNINTIHSNSQALQDIFAIYINQFKTDGYFVDLGCNEPISGNNSATLESMGWNGILVDYVESLVQKCNSIRKNKAIYANLINTSITDLLIQNNAPEIIDYLSMDLDYGAALPSIKSFDFNKFKIKCMTFEHDAYLNGDDMKNESREFLESKGMKIVCKDVTIFGGKSFEDWYVNPQLVSESVYSKIISDGEEYTSIIEKLKNINTIN